MHRWDASYAHKTDAFSATAYWRRDAALALSKVPQKTTRFLDLGFGTGRLLQMARSHLPRAEFYGVDLNEEGFELARHRAGPDIRLFTTLDSLDNDSIDACVIMHALPQFADPSAMLSWLWTKMTPGGTLIVITHNDWFYWLRKPWLGLNGYRSDSTITTLFTLGSLDQLMRDEGFLKIESDYFGGDGWPRFVMQARLFFHGRRPE